MLLSTVSMPVLTAKASPQSQDKWTASDLKKVIEGLGYEVKTLNAEEGKEKYEFVAKKAGLDIPVAAELSASKNFIWLTVFLGEVKETTPYKELLKANAEFQPSFFYVTASNKLMMGVAMENRALTSAIMRRHVEKLTEDVGETQDIWGK